MPKLIGKILMESPQTFEDLLLLTLGHEMPSDPFAATDELLRVLEGQEAAELIEIGYAVGLLS